ncbi:MAG: hypothetical protein ACT4QF_11905 [Sporichthyaceae bacterium]
MTVLDASQARAALPGIAGYSRAAAAPRPMALATSLLGAVTAVGAFVLLVAGVLASALLVARMRDATPLGLASGLASGSVPVSVVASLVLSAVVVISFACGGYVSARLNGANERRQAVAVWAWSVVLPTLLAVVLLVSVARSVLTALHPRGDVVLLLLTLGAMALLGALLGGESAQRARRSRSVPAAAGQRSA